MIKKIYLHGRYELARIWHFFSLLSHFNIVDSFKLRYFSIDVIHKEYLYFKPRKWSHDIKIRNNYRDKRT